MKGREATSNISSMPNSHSGPFGTIDPAHGPDTPVHVQRCSIALFPRSLSPAGPSSRDKSKDSPDSKCAFKSAGSSCSPEPVIDALVEENPYSTDSTSR